jgi:drug/metabolite transporter (DMT)-like permease
MAEIAVLGAVLCSVYGWILLKKIISEYKYSPIMANGIAMTIGGILALTHSYISGENWQPVPVSNYKPFILYSLTMCLISNIICYNLYGYLLKRFSANFMSFFGLVTPIFASFFGWLFLAETITWHFFASIAMFSIGLVLFYQEEIKKGKVFPVNSKLAKAV